MCIRDSLRTYCHQQQRKWEEYLPAAEDFINLAYHQAIDTTPFTAMFERRPPREITELIEFPPCDDYTFDQVKFYNKTVERAEKMREKYKKLQPKIIKYKIGELVLLIENSPVPLKELQKSYYYYIPVSYTHLGRKYRPYTRN